MKRGLRARHFSSMFCAFYRGWQKHCLRLGMRIMRLDTDGAILIPFLDNFWTTFGQLLDGVLSLWGALVGQLLGNF